MFIPHSLSVLHLIAQLLDDSVAFLNPETPEYQDWHHSFQTGLFNNAPLKTSPEAVKLVQALFLCAVSMYGGVFIPALKSFSVTDTEVRLTWDSGLSDRFRLGVWDTDFERFVKYFKVRCGFERNSTAEISVGTMLQLRKLIESYMIILNGVDVRLRKLSRHEDHFMDLFKHEMDRDLLFILCSCFPPDQLNALFLYIQQFFPDDLEVEKSLGRRINVVQLFQTPSSDIAYLIEKLKVYLDLYFADHLPIIKEITTLKTTEFMSKILQNKDAFTATLNAITSLQDHQIGLRVQLYSVAKRALDDL